MRLLYDQLARIAAKRNDPSFSYATWHMNQRRRQVLFEELRCCSLDLTLEVGCGDGFFTNILAGISGVIVGLDISLGMISKARERVSSSPRAKVHFIVGDAEHLPLRSNTFDCVVAINLLLHLFRPELALLDIARVLRQNGMALLETLNKFSPLLMFRRFGELLVEKTSTNEWAKSVNKLFKSYHSAPTYRSYSGYDMARLVATQPLATRKVRRYLIVGTQFPRSLVRLARILEPVVEKAPLNRMTLMVLYIYQKGQPAS